MPILKLRWSILGPKGLSIQWRSLLSPPASFSMISSARRSPVKRLNPSQVRLTCPAFAIWSCPLNSLEFYKHSVCWGGCDELGHSFQQKIVKSYWQKKLPKNMAHLPAVFPTWMTGQILVHIIKVWSFDVSFLKSNIMHSDIFKGPFSAIAEASQKDFSRKLQQVACLHLGENGWGY